MPETQEVQIRVPSTVLGKLEIDKVCHHRLKLWRPVTVAIVENPEGSILLVQSTMSKTWGFPQGGVGRYEGIIQGLARELHEETGIVASEVRSFCLLDLHNTPNRSRDGFIKGKRYYYFHVWCEGIPEIALQSTEVCGYQWLPPYRAASVISALGEEHRKKKESMLVALKNAVGY